MEVQLSIDVLVVKLIMKGCILRNVTHSFSCLFEVPCLLLVLVSCIFAVFCMHPQSLVTRGPILVIKTLSSNPAIYGHSLSIRRSASQQRDTF